MNTNRNNYFLKGTLISTTKGLINIEELKKGVELYTLDSQGNIKKSSIL